MISEEDEGRIQELCEDGLMTDGSHHKQWYLNEILKTLLGEKAYEELRKEYELEDYYWEDGMPP